MAWRRRDDEYRAAWVLHEHDNCAMRHIACLRVCSYSAASDRRSKMMRAPHQNMTAPPASANCRARTLAGGITRRTEPCVTHHVTASTTSSEPTKSLTPVGSQQLWPIALRCHLVARTTIASDPGDCQKSSATTTSSEYKYNMSPRLSCPWRRTAVCDTRNLAPKCDSSLAGPRYCG